ncbi:hypothetical protein BU23DRAFT_123937 [Bimuria novae-zelandiae CBS 107.79]|uniref:Uncharacterized protein n=1 Tax=Bimuria novae-zelandiae CBS 107.79 TaxID=1447943 RepID=A0A6A5V8Q5_9PLEO|nr:hypothetical protein BU23DRAFT_123937 [Bimuria novae-zelandiae CBS 107.79]
MQAAGLIFLNAFCVEGIENVVRLTLRVGPRRERPDSRIEARAVEGMEEHGCVSSRGKRFDGSSLRMEERQSGKATSCANRNMACRRRISCLPFQRPLLSSLDRTFLRLTAPLIGLSLATNGEVTVGVPNADF